MKTRISISLLLHDRFHGPVIKMVNSASASPGSFLVAQHLAQMMLVQALRLHLAEGLRGGVGWLFALADKQMSAAITSNARRSGVSLAPGVSGSNSNKGGTITREGSWNRIQKLILYLWRR
jgi:hypothetical protein